MYGSKIENIKANGKIIKCTEKAEFNGQMVKYMMVSMKTIKNMVQVLLAGQMEENMSVSGNKENNMEEGNIFYPMVVERLDSGYKVKGLNGPSKINEGIKTKKLNKIFKINYLY